MPCNEQLAAGDRPALAPPPTLPSGCGPALRRTPTPAGRRVRHKTAAQKLEEWQAEAKERELEKVAQRHLKELAKKQQLEQRQQVGGDGGVRACVCVCGGGRGGGRGGGGGGGAHSGAAGGLRRVAAVETQCGRLGAAGWRFGASCVQQPGVPFPIVHSPAQSCGPWVSPQVDVVEVRQQHQENLSGVLSAVQDALASGTAAAAAAAPAAGKRRPPLPSAGAKKRRIDPLAALDDFSSDDEDEEEDEESQLAEEMEEEEAAGKAAAAGPAAGKGPPAEEGQASPPAAASGGSNKSSSEGFEPAAAGGGEGSPATAEQPGQGAEPAAAAAGEPSAAAAEPAAQQGQQAEEQKQHEPVDLSAFGTPEELEAAVGGDRLKAELQVRVACPGQPRALGLLSLLSLHMLCAVWRLRLTARRQSLCGVPCVCNMHDPAAGPAACWVSG